MLTDSQRKRIKDVALGLAINRQKSIEDQIAALRKQIIAISVAANVPLNADLQELEDIVENTKKKSNQLGGIDVRRN